jgi:multiple sugar transport system ATP-binding protein
MEDAALANVPSERRIKGQVLLTEALGSEIIVHFTFPGEPVVTDDTKLLAKEAGGGGEIHIPGTTGVKFVASFAPRSRVHRGDEIEVAVDVERVHYFDPTTSLAIRA